VTANAGPATTPTPARSPTPARGACTGNPVICVGGKLPHRGTCNPANGSARRGRRGTTRRATTAIPAQRRHVRHAAGAELRSDRAPGSRDVDDESPQRGGGEPPWRTVADSSTHRPSRHSPTILTTSRTRSSSAHRSHHVEPRPAYVTFYHRSSRGDFYGAFWEISINGGPLRTLS
jgi:hypothetical protein